MLIIGFCHQAQVGKDTAALYLENKYPGIAKRVAFADKLKTTARQLFGLTWEQCYGTKEQKETVDSRYNLTPREILQQMGEKMREVYSDVWVDAVFNSVIPPLQKKGYELFLISDCRYVNEADKIRQNGGFLVKLLRDAGGTSVGQNHPSETAMADYPGFDFKVHNNGTFESFFAQLDQIMEEIKFGNPQRGN